MNMVINCPHCNQEMIIDDTAVGADVPCPTCSKNFIIPQGKSEEEVKKERAPAAGGGAAAPKPEEKKPEPKKDDKKKPMPSKEELAKLLPGANKGPSAAVTEEKEGMRVKVFQHHLCIDMGKDLFPDMVAKTLDSIDKSDIISVSPLAYSYKDSGGDIISDFGVMIVYYHRLKKDEA